MKGNRLGAFTNTIFSFLVIIIYFFIINTSQSLSENQIIFLNLYLVIGCVVLIVSMLSGDINPAIPRLVVTIVYASLCIVSLFVNGSNYMMFQLMMMALGAVALYLDKATFNLSMILNLILIALAWVFPIPRVTYVFSNRDYLLNIVILVSEYAVLYVAQSILHKKKIAEEESTQTVEELIKVIGAKREDALDANRAKSDFLANMSHEIRTPINAVLGMNEMILREATDPNVRDYADDIQIAGKNLLSIINTILDFSKIEDGKMEISPAEYDFPSVLNNLINSAAAMAKGKNLELKVDIDPGLPVVLYGDDLRISQVALNLLTNALKYTDKGSVSFTVREASRNGKEIFIDVDVSDTGIGIRPEDMSKMFESFGRLDEKRNRGIEGTGLGIAIVTKLLEMMGSELKVNSEYGKGSSFYFRIRQEIVDDSPIGKYTERFEKTVRQEVSKDYIYAPSARVLVVDDNEMNCKVVKHLLKQNGIVPDFAFSGQECIDKLSVKFYHMVFLDHMMPKMDGIETLNILKEKKLIPEGTVIIALTANAVVGAKEFYLEAGFDDYLSKPIEIEHLEAMLSEYLPENLTHLQSSSGEGKEAEPAADTVKTVGNTDTILAKLALEGIDVKAGLGYCGGNKEFYIEMLREYVSSYNAHISDLSTYLSEHNMNDYETLVHSIKSTSRTIGAAEISELAFELEKASREGNEAFVSEHHGKFSDDYAALKDMLEKLLGQ